MGTASSFPEVVGDTSLYFFHGLHEIFVFELYAVNAAMFSREIEVGKSYFGSKRKGKRGRGSAEKIPNLALFRGLEKFTP